MEQQRLESPMDQRHGRNTDTLLWWHTTSCILPMENSHWKLLPISMRSPFIPPWYPTTGTCKKLNPVILSYWLHLGYLSDTGYYYHWPLTCLSSFACFLLSVHHWQLFTTSGYFTLTKLVIIWYDTFVGRGGHRIFKYEFSILNGLKFWVKTESMMQSFLLLYIKTICSTNKAFSKKKNIC